MINFLLRAFRLDVLAGWIVRQLEDDRPTSLDRYQVMFTDGREEWDAGRWPYAFKQRAGEVAQHLDLVEAGRRRQAQEITPAGHPLRLVWAKVRRLEPRRAR